MTDGLVMVYHSIKGVTSVSGTTRELECPGGVGMTSRRVLEVGSSESKFTLKVFSRNGLTEGEEGEIILIIPYLLSVIPLWSALKDSLPISVGERNNQT